MKRKPTPRVYQCQIDESDEKTGVSLISFVSTPAIETDFIALSKQLEVRLAKDSAKQILTGPVLIPDQKIYRKDGEKEFYITFTADTIEGIRNKFHQKGNTHATNLEHEISLDGNYIVESWLISDSEKDKATALGFSDLPVGTWMASYKVPDKDFWEEKVVSGEVKGFSLEGFFSYEQLKTQLSATDMPNKKTGFLSRMKAAFAALMLSAMTLKDGTAIEVDDETKEVFNLDENGERGTALPDGDYSLEDDTTITVKDGKLSEETAETPKPEEENLEATVLADGTYELPGGDMLAIADGAYAIEKADAGTEKEETAMSAHVHMAAIVLEDDTEVTHDPIANKLYAADGALLPSGTYKTKEGVSFEVTTNAYTSQYWYEKSQTLSAQLKEVEEVKTKLAAEKVELQAKLAMKPATEKVKLGGDKPNEGEQKLSAPQQRLADLRAKNTKK